MPISTTDDYLDPCVTYSNNYSDTEFEDIVESICRTYKKVLKDRLSRGDSYTGFSKIDYKDNRDPEKDVSLDYVVLVFGSWTNVTDMLPIKEYDHHNKFKNKTEKYTIENFYSIMTDISNNTQKSFDEIYVEDFDHYRKQHKKGEIPGWRSFSRKIVGNNKWKDCVAELKRYAETL